MSIATQIEAMERALEKGVLKIKDGKREFTYANPADLVAALDKLKAQQAATSGSNRRGFKISKFKSVRE